MENKTLICLTSYFGSSKPAKSSYNVSNITNRSIEFLVRIDLIIYSIIFKHIKWRQPCMIMISKIFCRQIGIFLSILRMKNQEKYETYWQCLLPKHIWKRASNPFLLEICQQSKGILSLTYWCIFSCYKNNAYQ